MAKTATINMPVLKLYADGEEINEASISDLALTTSVYSELPELDFTVSDDMDYIKRLQITAGTNIKVIIIDSDNQKNFVQLSPFYVKDIEDPIDIDLDDLKGNLKVHCVHPFNLFKDFTDHAYAPQAASEIIKTLLQSSMISPLIGNINTLGKDIIDTDPSTTIRYKLGKSEIDFIKEDIMPFTTIENRPAVFYCDELSRFYLKSFYNMFSSNDIRATIALSDPLTVAKYPKAKPLKAVVAKLKIGSKVIDLLKVKTYIDMPILNVSARVQSYLNNKISDSSVMPIKQASKYLIGTTSTRVIQNSNFEDAVASTINSNFESSNALELRILCNTFVGDEASVGSVVWVHSMNSTDEKNHWATGKWIVASKRYLITNHHPESMGSELILIRSSIEADGTDLKAKDFVG